MNEQMWYTHTTEYSAMKRNKVWIPTRAWMNPENIMLSEIIQTQNKI